MPQRILVTGGCGFIGSHLVRRLVADGNDVVVLDDMSTGRRDHLDGLSRVQLIEGTVLDRDVMRRAVAGVSRVIHMAGLVGMRLATQERERAFTTSAFGTRILLDAAPRTPIVLLSSSAVYGSTDSGPVSESQVISFDQCLEYDGGLPGYSTGKRLLELLGAEACLRGQPILTIRPFNVVGPRQSGSYGMVLPNFVENALAGKAIRVFDDGHQTRTFSGVTTFVDRMVRLSARNDVWTHPQNVFNIGASEPVEIAALARIVIEATGSKSPLQFLPYNEVFPGRNDVRRRQPDSSRLDAVLGAAKWPSMRQIVLEYCAWRAAHHNVALPVHEVAK